MKTTTSRVRVASARLACAVREKGADHPDTVAARREFGAAKLAETAERMRRYGLDEIDMIAVVRTGQLAPEASAA
jgi:hypothetical protein